MSEYRRCLDIKMFGNLVYGRRHDIGFHKIADEFENVALLVCKTLHYHPS